MAPLQQVVENYGPVTLFLIVDLMSWRKVGGI